MTGARIVASSLNVLHGMQHTGLSGEALQIERSPAFKKAFVETITRDLGFGSRQLDMTTSADPTNPELEPHHERFVRAFGPDGHPPTEEARAFLNGEIARSTAFAEADPTEITAGEETMDCCLWIPPDWYTCGGFTLLRRGSPWTIDSAVVRYEEDHGKITDSVVRDALTTIEVMAQVTWMIEFL